MIERVGDAGKCLRKYCIGGMNGYTKKNSAGNIEIVRVPTAVTAMKKEKCTAFLNGFMCKEILVSR